MDKPAKILIVDDESVIRDIMEGLLLIHGYDLAFASNGLEALDQVAQLKPDLILLDVMMPRMNGLEVCQRLKKDETQRHIPIILVTAMSGAEDLAQGLDAGADDFLHKPFDNRELLARVRSMLRIKNQYDELVEQRRQLAAALELNEKFGRALAEHLAELELLHDMGLRLMSRLDMDSVLALISQAALDILPGTMGCIIHFILEGDQPLLPIVFSPGENSKMVHFQVGIEEIVEQAIVSRQLVAVPDVSVLSSGSPLSEMRSVLVAPLIDQEQLIGAMSVYSPQVDAFEQKHFHTFSILSNQATVAIVKARSIEERERLQQREKWAIRDLFQRYVSPTVVERLVEGGEDLSLGGKRQEITLLFADIRGFSTFSESKLPEQLIKVLNQYLALAVDAILAQEGTLDKFMGDAVMAFFNAPLIQSDHTLKAVRAALAMQQAIAAYNATSAPETHLNFGVGIHTGQAVVGNIGTAQQMNYTAIGDTVNVARRLQEQAKGGQIIVSRATYEAVAAWATVEDLGELTMKGRIAPVHAYLLLGLN